MTLSKRFTVGSIMRMNWPLCLKKLGLTCRVSFLRTFITSLLSGYLMDQKLGPSESVRWLVWFPSPACLLLAQCLQVPLSLTWEVMPEGKEEARQIPLRLVL